MSTRSTINFQDSWNTAKIYKHHDGYPSEGIPLLADFFTTVEEETNDTRFNDSSYLAAKFVVFLARMYTTPSEWAKDRVQGSMDFLSVGINQTDPGDIEYTYTVDCESHYENGWPRVSYMSVYNNEGWVNVPLDQLLQDSRRRAQLV